MIITEYKVRYHDNTGCGDSVESYSTEDAAEAAIRGELELVKEYFRGRDYDYADFYYEDGLTTEIWVSGDDEYASWTRLWS